MSWRRALYTSGAWQKIRCRTGWHYWAYSQADVFGMGQYTYTTRRCEYAGCDAEQAVRLTEHGAVVVDMEWFLAQRRLHAK